jgi:hypothetical protein
MNGTELLDRLIDVTTLLADVVEAENAALRERKAAELARRQDEKEKLTGDYERCMAQLRRNGDALKGAEPAALDRLRGATRRFQEILEEHRRAVQSAKAVSERMLRAIVAEASQRRNPFEGYDAGAAVRPAFAASRPTVSLAVNRVV